MRISDWSSDVCSSDLGSDEEDRQEPGIVGVHEDGEDDSVEQQVHGDDVSERPRAQEQDGLHEGERDGQRRSPRLVAQLPQERHEHDRLQHGREPVRKMSAQQHEHRSEEHTSELKSLMRNSYAVFCLKTKKTKKHKL